MKARVRRIINEARVQRTIDSKIWASMSSMSSRLRSTLAQEAKPMKRDTKDILLQKYVAGLLTMKVNCPNTVQEITKNKAYQNIGNAFIDAGGTIQEIQKLYQENGGVLTNEFHNDSDDLENDFIDNEPEEQDYPAYDEIPLQDTQNTFDDAISKYKEEPDYQEPISQEQDYPAYDEVKTDDNEPEDYPDYDEVDTVEKEDFSEKVSDDIDMENYFKSLPKSLQKARNNMYLVWDKSDGFVLSKDNINSIGQCVANAYNFIDKTPRFILSISDEDIRLNNAGNNSVYDDYYYKVKDSIGRTRMQIIPGSNYYPQEEKKGEFYTDILIDNDNEPAKYTKSLDNLQNINFEGVTSEQIFEIKKYLQKHAYLPTLPELAKAIELLPPGKYWTSSIMKNGTKNIILSVNPDKVIITDNVNDKAKVVTFIKF